MHPPTLLLASGLDPSGGAGLIADVRVAGDHGCRATGVVTASTVQHRAGVKAVVEIDPAHLRVQLEAVLEDGAPAAVKIGLVPSLAVAEVLRAALGGLSGPVVWDPVLAPSRGVPSFTLSSASAIAACMAEVADVLTPNRLEAERLSGRSIESVEDMAQAGAIVRAQGFGAVLLKGGHVQATGDRVLDLLVEEGKATELWGERLPGATALHGTGCALSTALACELALGFALPAACERAAAFVRERMRAKPASGAVY